MKRFVFVLFLFVSLCTYAQQIAEPQFVGEVLLVKSETTAIPLEKKTATVKTKAGASVYLTGIGSVKSRIHVEGMSSTVRYSQADGPIVLIVRAANNEMIRAVYPECSDLNKRRKNVEQNWQS